MDEAQLKSFIGKPTSKTTVVIERGPVANFATAVCDPNPAYRDPEAAKEIGLDRIPVPPTFSFVMDNWGQFPEVQPDDPPASNAMGGVVGPLMSGGGLILHGEQEFDYFRPVSVGDVLVGEGSIVDAYTKESKGRTMTFVVTETRWKDANTGEPVVTTRFNLIHRA
jgi:acyl dehydratase